jgi:hypothetical protein
MWIDRNRLEDITSQYSKISLQKQTPSLPYLHQLFKNSPLFSRGVRPFVHGTNLLNHTKCIRKWSYQFPFENMHFQINLS